MKLRKLTVGLFVTAAALFIPMSAVWAATDTDGDGLENVPVVAVSNKGNVSSSSLSFFAFLKFAIVFLLKASVLLI